METRRTRSFAGSVSTSKATNPQASRKARDEKSGAVGKVASIRASSVTAVSSTSAAETAQRQSSSSKAKATSKNSPTLPKMEIPLQIPHTSSLVSSNVGAKRARDFTVEGSSDAKRLDVLASVSSDGVSPRGLAVSPSLAGLAAAFPPAMRLPTSTSQALSAVFPVKTAALQSVPSYLAGIASTGGMAAVVVQAQAQAAAASAAHVAAAVPALDQVGPTRPQFQPQRAALVPRPWRLPSERSRRGFGS
jgi:hypothetical protein